MGDKLSRTRVGRQLMRYVAVKKALSQNLSAMLA
jgi:hypothetical protein